MRIIIDFDRTIFDTAKRIQDTEKLAKKYGISIQDWQKAWPELFDKKHSWKGLYNIWEHLERLNKVIKFDARTFLADFKKSSWGRYVYPDSRFFLSSLKNTARIVLITHGHKGFQELKIKQAKIWNYFDQVKVVPNVSKSKYLRNLIGKRELNIFLDDKPHVIDQVKFHFPGILAFYVRRPRSKYSKRPSLLRDFEVKNLNQALVIIELLKDTFTKDIDKAVQYLKRGKAVVYPTDTAYGLAVDATKEKALRELYKIKERGFNQPIHVIVSDLKMAKKYAAFDSIAEKLFKKYLPGALTLVLPLKQPLPNPPHLPGDGERWREVEALRLLSAGTGTIGVRMPDNKIALELVRKLGVPITTTSANPSGHKSGGTTPYSAIDSFKQFFLKKHQPDLYLDAGILPKQKPSTIIKIERNKIKTLRKGPVSVKT